MVSSPPPELLPLPPGPLLPDSPHAARAVSRTVAPVSAVAILRFIRISPEVGLGAGAPGRGPRAAGAGRGRSGQPGDAGASSRPAGVSPAISVTAAVRLSPPAPRRENRPETPGETVSRWSTARTRST